MFSQDLIISFAIVIFVIKFVNEKNYTFQMAIVYALLKSGAINFSSLV